MPITCDVGACYHLEVWIGSPILWNACRHHIYELHIGRLVEVLMGNKKEPGVPLFRRLKSDWYSLEINYSNLELFDYDSVPVWMAEEARQVMSWGMKELEKGTWPRADYKEFLQLTVICLGGSIEDFKFKLPGADHHARWMSKGIYFIKMWLLSKVFKLSTEEKEAVKKVVHFTVAFYTKPWLEAPLSSSAARNDLNFQYNVLRYRELEPKATWKIIQSIKRHHWYLTAQMITLALADPGFEAEEKEDLARKIHAMPRVRIETGRPDFPMSVWQGAVLTRPKLSSFLSSNSWLIFQLLNLDGSQV